MLDANYFNRIGVIFIAGLCLKVELNLFRLHEGKHVIQVMLYTCNFHLWGKYSPPSW